jgi:hypothetical protein
LVFRRHMHCHLVASGSAVFGGAVDKCQPTQPTLAGIRQNLLKNSYAKAPASRPENTKQRSPFNASHGQPHTSNPASNRGWIRQSGDAEETLPAPGCADEWRRTALIRSDVRAGSAPG